MSKGEEKIVTLLKKGKYKFEREKRFSDLKKGFYRYDFYVVGGRPTPVLIEFNGEQHYKQVKKFYHTRADFEKAKGRDRRKISYALAHGIPLYIIPFWEIENLKSAEDIFQEKFRARDRWKNERDWVKASQNLTRTGKFDRL